jgi:hypothetical protein
VEDGHERRLERPVEANLVAQEPARHLLGSGFHEDREAVFEVCDGVVGGGIAAALDSLERHDPAAEQL